MRKYIPLLTGVLLPIATFLNTQSLIGPGWMYHEKLHHHHSRYVYYKPFAVAVLSSISLSFGLVAVVSLFIRMLEKKIKWCTRLIILGAAGQGLFSLASVIAFIIWKSKTVTEGTYTDAGFYSAICAVLSTVVAVMSAYHHHMNRSQIYAYCLYELSPAQRQLILLTITSIAYTFAMGTSYAALEGWEYEDGVYWCVATLATIGFGDLYPQSFTGKLLLPLVASCGIAILGAAIYSIRQVALELLTHRLASEYSRTFGIPKENEYTEEPVVYPRRLSSPAPVIHRPWDETPNIPRPVTGSAANVDRRLSVPRDIPNQRKLQSAAFSAPSRPVPEQTGRRSEESAKSLDVNPNRHSAPPGMETFGVPISRSFTTTVLDNARTMVISRGAHLPQLTIVAAPDVRRRHVVEATRRTFRQQISFAILAVLANMSIFGGVFAIFENWNFFEGLYFAFVSLTTIGFGDYVLTTTQSRSIFIWFLYLGIGSVTYMFSLISERALDQWTVTVNKIENRVDRYERKARLKKMYKGGIGESWRRGRARRRLGEESDSQEETEGLLEGRGGSDEEAYLSDLGIEQPLKLAISGGEAPVWEGIASLRASPVEEAKEEEGTREQITDLTPEAATPELEMELDMPQPIASEPALAQPTETTPLISHIPPTPPAQTPTSVRFDDMPFPRGSGSAAAGGVPFGHYATLDSVSFPRGVIRLELPTGSVPQPSGFNSGRRMTMSLGVPLPTEHPRPRRMTVVDTGMTTESDDEGEVAVTERAMRMFSGRKSRRSSIVPVVLQGPSSGGNIEETV